MPLARSLLLTLPGFVAVSTAAAQQPPITILALSGTPYPTLPAGATLDGFGQDQAIAPGGTVVFTAYVREGTQSARQAVLRSTPSGPQIVARQNDPAPGAAPGLVLSVLQRATGTPAGAAFSSSIYTSGGVSIGQGIYTANPSLNPVAITGNDAPG